MRARRPQRTLTVQLPSPAAEIPTAPSVSVRPAVAKSNRGPERASPARVSSWSRHGPRQSGQTPRRPRRLARLARPSRSAHTPLSMIASSMMPATRPRSPSCTCASAVVTSWTWPSRDTAVNTPPNCAPRSRRQTPHGARLLNRWSRSLLRRERSHRIARLVGDEDVPSVEPLPFRHGRELQGLEIPSGGPRTGYVAVPNILAGLLAVGVAPRPRARAREGKAVAAVRQSRTDL